MQINSVPLHRPVAVNQTEQPLSGSNTEQAEDTNVIAIEDSSEPTPQVEPNPQEMPASTAEGTDDDKATGVLRLLQEGHFRGVADVRLRINFHDQIVALEQRQAAALASESLTTVVESISGQISTMLESESLKPDQVSAISDAADLFSSAAIPPADSTTSPEQLIEGIRMQFDDLTAALTAAFAEPIEEEIVEDVPSVSTEPEHAKTELTSDIPIVAENTLAEETPKFSAEEFIANLIESFESALSKLEAELSSLSVLPELSEPNGQGKAYEKFLSIYEELLRPADSAPPASTVDITL